MQMGRRVENKGGDVLTAAPPDSPNAFMYSSKLAVSTSFQVPAKASAMVGGAGGHGGRAGVAAPGCERSSAPPSSQLPLGSAAALNNVPIT